MVESHSFELFMYETVVQLHEQDLSALQVKRVTAKRSGTRFDPNLPRVVDSDDDDIETEGENVEHNNRPEIILPTLARRFEHCMSHLSPVFII